MLYDVPCRDPLYDPDRSKDRQGVREVWKADVCARELYGRPYASIRVHVRRIALRYIHRKCEIPMFRIDGACHL